MGSLSSFNYATVVPAQALWTKLGTFAFGAFAVANATANVVAAAIGAAVVIDSLKLKHSAAFAGPGILSCTASLGVAAEPDRCLIDSDVAQAPGDGVIFVAAGPWAEAQAAPFNLVLRLTVTGGLLNALNAGSIDVWALMGVAA